jgi:hypothetical protein
MLFYLIYTKVSADCDFEYVSNCAATLASENITFENNFQPSTSAACRKDKNRIQRGSEVSSVRVNKLYFCGSLCKLFLEAIINNY